MELTIGKIKPTRYDASTTSHASNHLAKRHNIFQKEKEPPMQSLIKQAKLDEAFTHMRSPFNATLFKSLLIQWVICMNQPFIQAVSKYFRRILQYLSPQAAKTLPTSPNTIRSWILSTYNESKETVRKSLNESPSAIHFSFDLWTSPNSYAILGVIGHWVDVHGILRTALLGMRRLDGAHSGENICEAFWEVVLDYGLTKRIGYFMLDNATSNDTALTILRKKLRDMSIPKFFSVSHRRLRCFGHIVNLVVKALLYGKDAEAFEIEDEIMERLEHEEQRLKEWRKKGPLGKLHNIVVHIPQTPQTRDIFLRIQKLNDKEALMVIPDNATRWNSTYSMLERAIALKEAVDEFVSKRIIEEQKTPNQEHKRMRRIDKDLLSHDDWEELKHLMAILQPFHQFCLSLENTNVNGSLSKVLPSMEILLEKLETAKVEYLDHPSAHLCTCINLAWSKLDKYYTLTGQSPVYIAAVVLNPRFKWEYLEGAWSSKPDWIQIARTQLKELWAEYYQMTPNLEDSIETRNLVTSDDFVDAWTGKHQSSHLVKHDELNSYISTPANRSIGDIRLWWLEQKNVYPNLSVMALEILAIPSMSADVERVFSR
jgi:hAT family C-terminal dimerisation region